MFWKLSRHCFWQFWALLHVLLKKTRWQQALNDENCVRFWEILRDSKVSPGRRFYFITFLIQIFSYRVTHILVYSGICMRWFGNSNMYNFHTAFDQFQKFYWTKILLVLILLWHQICVISWLDICDFSRYKERLKFTPNGRNIPGACYPTN